LIDAESQRHLLANIERARELGAEVVRLKSDDAVAALLDFAALARRLTESCSARSARRVVAPDHGAHRRGHACCTKAAEFDVFVAAREDDGVR